jgi:signal transduction histidine kinase
VSRGCGRRSRQPTTSKSLNMRVDVREEAGSLTFVVSDNGAGFDVATMSSGVGFTNMLDRLGALGRTLRVKSASGKGTRVTGAVPVESLPRS